MATARKRKWVGKPQVPGIDFEALADWQRGDLEALAQANRQAYEGIKALVERRDEILRETLAQWRGALKSPAGKQAFAEQSEAAKRGMQQAIDHLREWSEMEAKVRTDTWKIAQERLQENMATLQKLLLPK